MTTQTQQTTQTPSFSTILPGELNCPKLKPRERNALWLALDNASRGGRVWVSCTYRKETDAAPRLEGSDYAALPGISKDVLLGPVVRVFRRKADNLLRFTVFSVTRQSFATIIPEGLTGFEPLPPVDLSLTKPEQPAD